MPFCCSGSRYLVTSTSYGFLFGIGFEFHSGDGMSYNFAEHSSDCSSNVFSSAILRFYSSLNWSFHLLSFDVILWNIAEHVLHLILWKTLKSSCMQVVLNGHRLLTKMGDFYKPMTHLYFPLVAFDMYKPSRHFFTWADQHFYTSVDSMAGVKPKVLLFFDWGLHTYNCVYN